MLSPTEIEYGEEGKGKEEEAHITMETQVRNKTFYFVTACTSHMTLYAGHFLNYTEYSGFVKSN
jgi:hypothetical protein